MVMLQVDQVDALFKEIEELEKNNWQEVISIGFCNVEIFCFSFFKGERQ